MVLKLIAMLLNPSLSYMTIYAHHAGKLKIWGGKKGGKKRVFEQLDTLELAAYGPREHINVLKH
jgi:hypothetical protein